VGLSLLVIVGLEWLLAIFPNSGVVAMYDIKQMLHEDNQGS
jgi:hypothetical protein